MVGGEEFIDKVVHLRAVSEDDSYSHAYRDWAARDVIYWSRTMPKYNFYLENIENNNAIIRFDLCVLGRAEDLIFNAIGGIATSKFKASSPYRFSFKEGVEAQEIKMLESYKKQIMNMFALPNRALASPKNYIKCPMCPKKDS